MASHEHLVLPAKVYHKVLLALLVLTFITILAAQFDFGFFSTLIALSIATVKAGFVAAVFMNLKYDDRMYTMVFCIALFFLALLCLFLMMDIYTRVFESNPL